MNLQHSAIWMAGVYLMLLMQFLENKVALELTRSEFVEAQEVGGMSRYWYVYMFFYNDMCVYLSCDLSAWYRCSLKKKKE